MLYNEYQNVDLLITYLRLYLLIKHVASLNSELTCFAYEIDKSRETPAR